METDKSHRQNPSRDDVIARIKPDDDDWEMDVRVSGVPVQSKSPHFHEFVRNLQRAGRKTVEDYLKAFQLPTFDNWDELLGKAKLTSGNPPNSKEPNVTSIRERVVSEREAFKRMHSQLRLVHDGEFVAVENGRAVAFGKTSSELIGKLTEMDPLNKRFFYVAEINDSQFTLPPDFSLTSYR